MAQITGSEILARALLNEGTRDLFFLMGGPMIPTEVACQKSGMRMIDVRHEQAAALMAQAYARLTQRPGVCMAASGPGVINLITGMANAHIDGAPVVAIGGSSSRQEHGWQSFQEIDQVAMMRPCTKWAEQVQFIERIPERVNTAFQKAMGGKPGPVYLDIPGDILGQSVDEDRVDWSLSGRPLPEFSAPASPAAIAGLIHALGTARKPIIVAGSGVIWGRAWEELRAFVDRSGIPFYPTPQGRGSVPDDHPLCFPAMRSAAFREADLVIVVGTRMNYMIGFGQAPRFNADAVFARIDIDPDEIATAPRRIDIPLLGDCGVVLRQLAEALGPAHDSGRYAEWRGTLAEGEARKSAASRQNPALQGTPIHPLRLCAELRDFMDRDAILAVDGQEILNYGRQAIPTFAPAHRLNSGPFGMMGVGLPFGLGAKVACPDRQVIVLHGDGSFGLNAMEVDTAIRLNIPVLIVLSNNGGWTAIEEREKAGRDLGFTRYDRMVESLGGYGEYVETPEDIAPALRRAQAEVARGRVALVNVKTDSHARAITQKFTKMMT